jgi:hypothetical protein
MHTRRANEGPITDFIIVEEKIHDRYRCTSKVTTGLWGGPSEINK